MLSCRGSATIARKFATAQLARTLATLLGGGIPLVNALEIARAVDDQSLSSRASSTTSGTAVQEGQSFAPRCWRAACFPTWR